MGNQTDAPAFSAAYWPEFTPQESFAPATTAAGPASLQMDPAEVFNYLQNNRQQFGLSNQFQAYNEGDAYVMRMSRQDAQHLMDAMAGYANAYMQMAQRNPQLLQAMNGQRMLLGPVGESACPCGGSCQCCGGCNGSWNRGNAPSTSDSTAQQPIYVNQTPEYQYPPNNGTVYPPGYGGNNGYNGYNGYGWNRGNQGGWGGGNPMQSLGYGGLAGGGNPQQMLRYAGANLVSNLIFSGINGGGFGRFHR